MSSIFAPYDWLRPVLCDKPKLKPLSRMMSVEASILDQADRQIRLTARYGDQRLPNHFEASTGSLITALIKSLASRAGALSMHF